MAAKNGHFSLCKILLGKEKFDVNVTDDHKRIPLHFLTMNGCYKLFQFLLDIASVIDLKEKMVAIVFILQLTMDISVFEKDS